jgi:arginyl-tRNA synthetase
MFNEYRKTIDKILHKFGIHDLKYDIYYNHMTKVKEHGDFSTNVLLKLKQWKKQ